MKRLMCILLVLSVFTAYVFSDNICGHKRSVSRYIRGDNPDPMVSKMIVEKGPKKTIKPRAPEYIYIDCRSWDPMVAKLMKVKNEKKTEKPDISTPSHSSKEWDLAVYVVKAWEPFKQKNYAEALAMSRQGLKIASFIEKGIITSEYSSRSISEYKQKLREINRRSEHAVIKEKAAVEFSKLGLKLSGIIWHEQELEAVVSGSLVKTDDTVKGVRIIAIYERSVKAAFSFEGRVFYYTLTL